ncbi:MAG: hypothetical protein QOK28_2640 [Actinomycetota bacterium]|jgi:hypothetical protein
MVSELGGTAAGRRSRTALTTIAFVAVTLLASGCALGDKQAMAERISDAADKAIAAGSISGQYDYTFKPLNTPAGLGAALGARGVAKRVAPVAVNFATNRSRLALADTKLIYSRSTVYGRKLAAASSGRPWVRLNFAHLERDDSSRLSPGSFLAVPYNLTFQVRLLKGALTGSVEKLGSARVAGVPTVHYKMNVDFEKAAKGLPDKSVLGLEKVFRANSFKGSVYKAEVWIDAAGLPRRIVVRLKQEITKNETYAFTANMLVDKAGGHVDIQRPDLEQIAEVANLPQLVQALKA